MTAIRQRHYPFNFQRFIIRLFSMHTHRIFWAIIIDIYWQIKWKIIRTNCDHHTIPHHATTNSNSNVSREREKRGKKNIKCNNVQHD